MDKEKLWKQVLAELELTITRSTFQTAFAKTSLLSIEKGVATIGVPNPVLRSLIENRYYSLIKSILDHHTKENTSLVFALLPKEATHDEAINPGPLFDEPTPSVSPFGINQIAKKMHIRPDATFENFAVSSTNQLAYAAATAVAATPGSAYNPLFFYGGVGVGKTHLMHAVANTVLQKNPSTKIVYCMGEEFLNEFIESIQNKTAIKFKQKYRSAQLLLVDDVQFIAGKQTAQEEFFHTFVAIHREGGQIILTSDRPPSEISKLEDRLRSRFEGGLIVDVASPDLELRIAIVNIKAEALGLSIPSDASQIIASTITDTRAIEGFLKTLMNDTALNHSQITYELVSSLLKNKFGHINIEAFEINRVKRVTPLDVLEAVSVYYNIKPMHLKGPKRDRPIARPRQLVMYICKHELNVTLDDIGGLLGGRDHTTVLHGIEKIEEQLTTDKQLQKALLGIKTQLFTQ
jgi:chromosomal replication initiator protein